MIEQNNTKTEETFIDVSSLKQRDEHKKILKKEITEELIEENMEMVRIIAGTITASGKLPPGTSYDDLVSYGVEGLIKAWQGFDENRGILFKTYASYRVRGEIMDKIRKEWRYRNPAGYKNIYGKRSDRVKQYVSDLGEDENSSDLVKDKDPVQKVVAESSVVYLLSLDVLTNVSSESAGVDDSAECLIDEMEFARERAILWEEVKNLTLDEKKIVNLFYIENKKQNEISEIVGLSKSKVSRMHVKLIDKLRRRLKRRVNS